MSRRSKHETLLPPLPAGELRALRAEVVGLLEALAEEVRRLGGRGQLAAAPSSRRATTQHAQPAAGRHHLTSTTFNNRFQ